jgi:Uma2 family endonuclease
MTVTTVELLTGINAMIVRLRRALHHDHGDEARWTAWGTTAPRAQALRARLRAAANLLHVERATARGRRHGTRFTTLDEQREVKHEVLDGHVWAMAGGTPEHAAIAGNITTMLNVQLRDRRCRVFSSDLRVRVRETGLGTYPDVTVVRGHIERDPDDRAGNTVVNPRVLVEVLSKSNEDYDRNEKLSHYQRIPAVEEIVLVAFDRRELEIVRRLDDGTWTREVVSGDGVATLASISCELPLVEVYRDPLA